jgi:hypothetical protein
MTGGPLCFVFCSSSLTLTQENWLAFVGGFFIALIVVMVFLLIRFWAKDKLERWG